MSAAYNFAPPSGVRPRPVLSGAREPRALREDRLRRRAGAAVARLDAEGNALAALIHKHHTAITNRKAGRGPLGDLLCEVHAWELAGHDCTPLVEALIATVEEARAARDGALPAALDLAVDEANADAAEDCAQTAYLATRTREDARRWLASLEAYAPRMFSTMRALRREVA